MAHLLSRVRGKTLYLLILTVLFVSGCSSDDDDTIVTPEPTNSAPVITSADADMAPAGAAYTYALTATDADGDALTFQASLLPSWLSFNSAGGELSGTPSRGEAGDYQVTLAASDGMDSTPLFLTISVVIGNAAPEITSIANNNGVVGSNYSYALTATDIDGDTLVTSLVGTLPAWASFDAASSTISGSPDATGDVEIELSVSDGELSSNQKYTLVVTSEPSVVIGFDETVVFSDFGGAVTDVIANPDASGINTSDNVGRMQKFAGEVFGGTTITLDSPINLEAVVQPRTLLSSTSFSGKSIVANNVFTLKVWSPRQVALTFKLEGETDASDVERVVSHDGTGWEELSFDFTDVTGEGYTGVTLIFENGVNGDAAGEPANWTFYFDDMVIPFVSIDNGGGSTESNVYNFEGAADSYAFDDFAGGAASVVANPDASGINTSAQVVQMLKFAGDVFGGSTLTLVDTVNMPADAIITMKVWSQRAVPVLLKLEDGPTGEITANHSGSGWEELSFDFTGISGPGLTKVTLIFDNGVNGDAANDAANWTFYFDDMIFPAPAVIDGDREYIVNDLEGAIDSYSFGDFEGGAGSIVANPDATGINTSAQVGQMLKFAGAVFGGTTLTLDSPVDVPENAIMTMKVWSQRAVPVLFKLEGGPVGEVPANHSGSGWEELSFNFTGIMGTGVTGVTLIFDGAVSGDAANDAVNWTFYFDDIAFPLAEDDGGNGGGTDDAQLTTNGDFEAGDLSGWAVSENNGSITVDDTQDSGSSWVAHVVAGPTNNPSFSQAGLAVGTVMPGDTIDISFDMCGSAASGGVIFPALLSEFGSDTGSDRQTLETIAVPPSVWTRYNYSAAAGGNVTGGVSLQLDVVCGGDAACVADVYFDNVSVTIGGGAVAGTASGASCIADDNGGGGNGGGTTDGSVSDLEGAIDSYAFSDFEGGEASIVANPDATGINTSAQVGQMLKKAGATYGGSTLTLDSSVDIPANAVMTLKVWSQRAVPVLFKLEGGPVGEISADHSGSGWEELSFDFTGISGPGVTAVTLIFDNGTVGDAENDAANWTFYFDDITFPAADDVVDPDPDPVLPLAVELVVFETLALPEWASWTDGDANGSSEVLQDGDNGGVTKFTLFNPTVAGFTSRDGGGAVNGMTFDASTLVNGVVTFDFKMVKEPTAGLVDWKFKVESSTSTAAEVNLSTALEGHATPILDTWQTYSFPIATLVAAGLDAGSIDLFMVFPDYNSAAGAEFYLDNFKITSGGEVVVPSGPSSMSGGSLMVDVTAGIDFEGSEADQASWDVFENGTNPALEFVANPDMAGNTTAGVAKLTLEAAADPNSGKFAGAVTRTVTTFKLSTNTVIAKIWVWKDKISPVGIKFERKRGDGYGSHGELTVSNTLVNQWEQLTIDFTAQLGLPENDEISGIAIFPDMVDGRSATVVYLDEITFTAN